MFRIGVFCKRIPELDMRLNNTTVVLTHFTITHITFKGFIHMSSNGSNVQLILTDAAEMEHL